ncbi:MAG: hypothetical protein HY811_04640, partial [Planctomycetes bacterium]|nr:hypothetical protein [Planctomycetota bacterium]
EIRKSDNDPAVIKEQNDETNEVVQGFVNKSLHLEQFETGGSSHVDFVYDELKGLYLEILVNKKP